MKTEEEIVARFFERGRLLTPSALDALKGSDGAEAVNDAPGLVLDSGDVRKEDTRIVKNLTDKPKEATTEDFIKFYMSKYEKMKSILTGRLQKNFVSTNKIGSSRNEVYVIGIVKDMKKGKIELEDASGTVPVVFEEDVAGVELDDVIAVRGNEAGNVIYGKQVVFPDIPLRQPVKGHGTICLASNLCLDEAPGQDVEKFFQWMERSPARYIFLAGVIGDREKLEEKVQAYCHGKKIFLSEKKEDYPSVGESFAGKNITALSNPAIVDVNGVKVLNIADFGLQMLKKRYLGKTKTILPEDYLALDTVPDIVNFASNEHSITNYKSVTIASSGSMMHDFRPVTIDLATREAAAESTA